MKYKFDLWIEGEHVWADAEVEARSYALAVANIENNANHQFTDAAGQPRKITRLEIIQVAYEGRDR